ncbi:hypothetical protein DPEC_G00181170 [Dallia pectoralis]|uniref:Uncharacterized protein n=1 Tax=Dallia pectoralis TaxID=75939 RepID=A0ACC2GAG2_DALPE|nr:hypothetical protein DPEC_G00181170 [Dallia pectoralis]
MLYSSADIINVVLGFPTNVYVLWLIVTGQGGTITSDFFVLNLAVSEILSSISNMMFITSGQLGLAVLVKFGQFFAGFTLYGRPLFQSCICVERYLAVIHPVTFLKYKPLRYRVGCSGVVWVLVIGSCFEYMFVESVFACKYYAMTFNLVLFSVMVFCCLAVLRALKRPGPGDREGDGDREGTNNMKLRAFRIISTIMVAMVLMYLPLVLLLTIYHYLDPTDYCFGMSICFSIIIIGGFVQPLLYLHRAGKLPCLMKP